jgi:hypothetical protein
MDTPALLSAETLNIYAESTCNFEKVVVRKVERKFEFTSLRHRVYLLYNLPFTSGEPTVFGRKSAILFAFRESSSLQRRRIRSRIL